MHPERDHTSRLRREVHECPSGRRGRDRRQGPEQHLHGIPISPRISVVCANSFRPGVRRVDHRLRACTRWRVGSPPVGSTRQ
ncbi:MAG: hypothetical protein HIU88_10860 [Acidobacteria bacterium]|nr:hypothetical protein [Acidobacteriota bacterium]